MSVSSHQPEPDVAGGDASDRGRVWLAVLVLIAATLAAYHNSFSVPFLFDDFPAIVENPAIRQFWPDGAESSSRQTGGLTTSGRPIVALSLAFNHAISGGAVWSYHAVNVLIHVTAGLCLLGVVRRTLLLSRWRGHFSANALPLALVVAALWTLHPLQTESVTYVVQRAESLAGLFYLLTLYGFIRSVEGTTPLKWRIFSVVACLLGMGSKEVVASAPLIVLLYDRTFVSGTLRAAWLRHRGHYLALGATWLVLAGLVIGTASRGGTAGFGTEMSSWAYALTQARAIVHYLGLSVWPAVLVFDYGLGTVRDLGEVLPQALGVLALIAMVIVALRRWPVAGFLGVWFLALLAPSSSIIPVATQTMAEHRMYLPLAAVVAAVVFAVYRLTAVRLLAWGGVAALALGALTVARNADYRSELAIWGDTARKLPGNARAHNNLGQAFFRAGQIDASIASYKRALQLQPKYPETHYNLGVALAKLGQLAPAIAHYEKALTFQPAYPEADNNLGNALVAAGRIAEAIPHYERALTLRPDFAEAHNNLGNALLQSGRMKDAAAYFRRALELKRDYPEANYNLGNAYAEAGEMTAALDQYRRALTLKSNYVEAHVNAGNALLALGRPAEAIVHYEQAVALNPRMPDAHYNLGAALLEQGRWNDAIPVLETVLRLDANFVRAERALGFAFAKAGRPADAIPHYERYLRVVPDDAEARDEWRQLRGAGAGSR